MGVILGRRWLQTAQGAPRTAWELSGPFHSHINQTPHPDVAPASLISSPPTLLSTQVGLLKSQLSAI